MGQADCYIRLAKGTLEEPVSAHADNRTDDLHLLCHDPGYWHEVGTSFLMQVDQAFTRITEGSGRCPDRAALSHTLDRSPSTLHRRLQQNGTSFQRVKNAWQHKTALFLIGRGDMIHVVARRLGFTDARSFRRAFIAWTGRTPSSFRASFQAGASPHGTERA
jgi:AraC-like DNA-binding protein